MKIVIDISESKYNAIKKLKDIETSYPTTLELYKAVKDGTPLPKEHGRIGDLDALKLDFWDNRSKLHRFADIANTIDKVDRKSVV